MPHTKPMMKEKASPRRLVYLGAGIIVALVTAWLIFPAQTRPPANTGEAARLEGALRAGEPEFEKYRERIVMAEPAATVSSRALGDVVVDLKTSIRNETGRRINGLEMRGAVMNAQGALVGERTAVIIPTQQTTLEPGEEMNARLLIEGISPDAARADVRLEVTGLWFK